MKQVYRPTWVEINMDNLRRNFRNIRALLDEKTKFCAVIKANGYGHGSVELAKLYEEEGADYFAVATCEEALELRDAGIGTPLMCLGYVPEDRFGQMIEREVDITIYSLEKAKRLSEEAVKRGKEAKVHIKLDTGMSRLGYPCREDSVQEIKEIAALPGIRCRGLFTHFALADSADPSYTKEQFKRYLFVSERLEQEGVGIEIRHVCNSAGIMMFPEYHLDMVRAGIVLYGHYPSEEVDKSVLKLYPAMSLRTTVAHVKLLEEGRGISYGHKYHTRREERIATIPIGYADGFTRMLSGKADVRIGESIVPVVGRICMDQCMLNVTGLDVKVGDMVTIFSDEEELAIERFGERLGTINYELLCMIQRRVPRVYRNHGETTAVIDYLEKK